MNTHTHIHTLQSMPNEPIEKEKWADRRENQDRIEDRLFDFCSYQEDVHLLLVITRIRKKPAVSHTYLS